MIVVLGGLQCGGFLLLGTLLLARGSPLVLVCSRHVLDRQYQSIQLLGRRFQGGRFRLLRSDPKECRMWVCTNGFGYQLQGARQRSVCCLW